MAVVGNLISGGMAFSPPRQALNDLSLTHRVEGAVAALQHLESCRTQWRTRISEPIYREAIARVNVALRDISDAVGPELHIKVANALESDTPITTINWLVDKSLPLLRDRLEDVRRHQELLFSDMNLVVNGSTFSRPPRVPEWARGVMDKPHPGIEIKFENGRIWIRDDRGLAQRLFSGLSVGPVRLRRGVEWPVAPGDTVRVGGREINLNLPSAKPLESIRGEIIALQETFKEIHRCPEFHLSGLPEDVALQMFRSLAIAVQGASTPDKLIRAVNTSIVPVDDSIVQGMLDVFDRKAGASVDNVPEACGLRKKLDEIRQKSEDPETGYEEVDGSMVASEAPVGASPPPLPKVRTFDVSAALKPWVGKLRIKPYTVNVEGVDRDVPHLRVELDPSFRFEDPGSADGSASAAFPLMNGYSRSESIIDSNRKPVATLHFHRVDDRSYIGVVPTEPVILKGSVPDVWKPPVHLINIPGLGEFAQTTTQGINKGDSEDGVGVFVGPDHALYFEVSDGVGGNEGGEVATEIALNAFAQVIKRGAGLDGVLREGGQAIRDYNKKNNKDADACVVAACIRPATASQPPILDDVRWAGDANLSVYRRGSDGGYQRVYWTRDDSHGSDDVDEGLLGPGGVLNDVPLSKITLMIQGDPDANIVTNALAQATEFHKIEKGYVPDTSAPAGRRFAQEYLGGFPLQEGDLVIAGSDGYTENWNNPAICELISGCLTAERALKQLTYETHRRMKILDSWTDNTGQGYYRFERDGRTFYIDQKCLVYENIGDRWPVAHYKKDHFSLQVFLVNPYAGLIT